MQLNRTREGLVGADDLVQVRVCQLVYDIQVRERLRPGWPHHVLKGQRTQGQ